MFSFFVVLEGFYRDIEGCSYIFFFIFSRSIYLVICGCKWFFIFVRYIFFIFNELLVWRYIMFLIIAFVWLVIEYKVELLIVWLLWVF